MSLKTEDPKIDIFALFPKGAGTSLVEGEAPPSARHEFESHMSAALAKIAPTDPNLPRRIGMREIFTDEPTWIELAGETYADYVNLDPSSNLPTVTVWPALPGNAGFAERLAVPKKMGGAAATAGRARGKGWRYSGTLASWRF